MGSLGARSFFKETTSLLWFAAVVRKVLQSVDLIYALEEEKKKRQGNHKGSADFFRKLNCKKNCKTVHFEAVYRNPQITVSKPLT